MVLLDGTGQTVDGKPDVIVFNESTTVNAFEVGGECRQVDGTCRQSSNIETFAFCHVSLCSVLYFCLIIYPNVQSLYPAFMYMST